MKTIIYKDSWVKFQDCIDGMKEFPDKSIDLGITDIPFGVNIKKTRKTSDNFTTINSNKKSYEDNPNQKLLTDSFHELRRICNGVIIYCGQKNLAFYCQLETPRQFLFQYSSNRISNGSLSYISTVMPLVCYGKFHHRIKKDIFIYPAMNGFLRTDGMIHPCPLIKEFWYDIINQLKPTSILDPFMGSGTTLEVGLQLDIPCYGFELMEEYAVDIEKRIERVKYYKKSQTIDGWINNKL